MSPLECFEEGRDEPPSSLVAEAAVELARDVR